MARITITPGGSPTIESVSGLSAALDSKLSDTDISPVVGLSMRVQNLAVSAGTSQATVTWEAPASTVGVNGYEVRHRLWGSVGSWTVDAFVASTVFTATVTGLSNNTDYEFDVICRYGVKATPFQVALYGDLFSGSSTWTPTSTRTASDGGTARPWNVFTASTTSPAWSYQLYSGAVRASLGNTATFAILDTGAASGRTIRASWQSLHATLTSKRRAEIGFRTSLTDPNGNFWGIHGNDGPYTVRKVVAGTSTTVFTSNVTAAAGDVITVVLGASNAITISVNGTQLWTSTETDLAANTGAGFRVVANAAGSSTTAQDQTSALDYFLVYSS